MELTKAYLDTKLEKKFDELGIMLAKSFASLATKDEVRQAVANLATKSELAGVKSELAELKGDVGKIKSSMVTQEFLTTKLFDLRGDLVVLTRKEDTKVKTLIDILQKRKVLQPEDVAQLTRLEPFAV